MMVIVIVYGFFKQPNDCDCDCLRVLTNHMMVIRDCDCLWVLTNQMMVIVIVYGF